MQPDFDLILKVNADHSRAYSEQSVLQMEDFVAFDSYFDDVEDLFVGDVAEL